MHPLLTYLQVYISIEASPSLGPPSFLSPMFRIQYANSRNSLTLVKPSHNVMFFVGHNTLQAVQILEKLSVAKQYLVLFPLGLLEKFA